MFKLYIMRRAGVCEIEIVCLCGVFCGKCVNLLDDRQNAVSLSQGAHNKKSLMHILHLALKSYGTRNLEIGKAIDLGLAKQLFA